MGLFGRKCIAGVEIDSFEVRVVELAGNPGSAKLLNIGRRPLPEGAVKDGKVNDAAAVTEALSSIWKELGIRTREVIIGVSNQDVLVRFAMLPKVPNNRLENMIRFQAQDFLPIAINEVELDYLVAGEEQTPEGAKYKVLLVAGRKAMIQGFLSAFESAGLRVLDIDISTLALGRLIPSGMEADTCMVVNIGYEQVNMLMTKMSIPQLARIFSTAQAFTGRPGSVPDSISEWAAKGTLPGEVGESLLNVLSREIRSSIGYFQSQSRDMTVSKLYICGCGSTVSGIVGFLSEALGIAVEALDPMSNIDTSSARNRPDLKRPSGFSVALSLAMRGLEG